MSQGTHTDPVDTGFRDFVNGLERHTAGRLQDHLRIDFIAGFTDSVVIVVLDALVCVEVLIHDKNNRSRWHIVAYAGYSVQPQHLIGQR